jgi:hypothetical protein
VVVSLHDELSARARDRWPADADPVRAGAILTRALTTNGAGRGTLRFPAPQTPGRYWARLEATDAKGRRGVGWCALRVEAPLSVTLHAPSHLVAGDRSEATVVVRCAGPALLVPDGVLRVSWKGVGLKLGPPKIRGAQVLLEGDAGSDTVRLGASAEVQLTFALTAPSPRGARITVSAQLEGDPAAPVGAERALPVRVRGLFEERTWSGVLEAGESTLVRLELPKGALPGSGRLEAAVDPTPATAALAGLGALSRAPGLRAALGYQLAHRAVARMIEARDLKRTLPPAPPLDALLARLLAARDEGGAWGESTPSLRTGLRLLAREGVAVPPALLAGDALPANPLSLAGKAGLLSELNQRGRDPGKQAKLLGELLAARAGTGWRDPDAAAAAVRALAELASGAEEVEGSRLLARLESDTLLDAFSGNGLAEWPDPARREHVRSRSRLTLESKAGGDLSYALRLRAPVPRARAEPTASGGLRLTRTLTRAGEKTPLSGAVPAGTRLELTLRPTREAGAGEGPLLLELPLPGGVRLLGLPAALEQRGDTLFGEVGAAPLTLRLLCLTPGEYTWLPARVRSPSEPERVATSAEAQLRIRR